MTTFSFFCANRSTLSWAGRTFEDGVHKMRPATMLAWSRQSQTISIVLDKERSGRDAMIKLSLSAISLLRHGRDIRYCYFSDLCILTSGMRMRDKAGRAMWPFGKKQISVRDATVDFYAKIAVAFEQNYEAILEIFRSAYDEDCPFEEVIYMEVIPAVWALGIEPVQNLWGEAQFKRVRAEMLVQIDQSHSPMTKPLVERFLKHTQLLRAGLAKGSATYNSDHIIKELGLAVQPMTSLKLSTQLAMLVLPYWKELHRTHNIY